MCVGSYTNVVLLMENQAKMFQNTWEYELVVPIEESRMSTDDDQFKRFEKIL